MNSLKPFVFGTLTAALLAGGAASDDKKPVASYKDGKLTYNGKTLPKLPCDIKEAEIVFGKASQRKERAIGSIYIYDDLGIEVGESDGKLNYVAFQYGSLSALAKKPYVGTISIDEVKFASDSDVTVVCKKVPKLKADKGTPRMWQNEDGTVEVWGNSSGWGLDSISFNFPQVR